MTLDTFGPYQLSLVGIEAPGLKNMTPPSLLLAGHAIMLCALAIAAAPGIGGWARRPRIWRLVVMECWLRYQEDDQLARRLLDSGRLVGPRMRFVIMYVSYGFALYHAKNASITYP